MLQLSTMNETSGETLENNPNKKKIIIWSVVAAIVVLALLIVVGSFSGLIGARVATGLPFKINGPDELVPGRTANVSWDTSPENQQQYPNEKIEFCKGQLFGDKCITLNASTANDGEALIFVPNNISKGSGYLRLTARNRSGVLNTGYSMARNVNVAAAGQAQDSTIAPANVGGGAIGALTAVGPRIGVNRGGTYTVILPEPSVTKKIEVCQQGGRCYTVASSVKGSSARIKIPGIAVGARADLKVSERGANELLTGRILFRRALLIKAEQIQSGGDSGGSGGGGGGSSSGGSSSSSNKQTSSSSATPQVAAAEFIVPVDDEQVELGSDVDVRVKLTEIAGSNLKCQQWKINGRYITESDWEDGQSPDKSAGACN